MDDTNVQGVDQPQAAPTKGGPGRKRSRRSAPTTGDAAKRLQEFVIEREEAKYEQEVVKKGNDWFVRCRHCNGAAVFLVQCPPGKTIEPDNWYSMYRDAGTPFFSDRIICQECGSDIQAAMSSPGGSWTIAERWIQSPTDIKNRQKEADMQRLEFKKMREAKLQIMDGEGAV